MRELIETWWMLPAAGALLMMLGAHIGLPAYRRWRARRAEGRFWRTVFGSQMPSSAHTPMDAERALRAEHWANGFVTREQFDADLRACDRGELDTLEFARRWQGRIPPRLKCTPTRTYEVHGTRRLETKRPEKMTVMFRVEKPVRFEWSDEARIADAYKPGQWVRWKADGQLLRVVEAREHPSAGWAYTLTNGNSLYQIEQGGLEAAAPRTGEWWQKLHCSQSGYGHDTWHESLYQPFKVEVVSEDAARVASECGCLVPVNFGRGTHSIASNMPAAARVCPDCKALLATTLDAEAHKAWHAAKDAPGYSFAPTGTAVGWQCAQCGQYWYGNSHLCITSGTTTTGTGNQIIRI